MTALAAALVLAGLAALATAAERHHRPLLGRPGGRAERRACRLAGSVLLLAALAVAVDAAGWSAGLVTWISLLGAGTLACMAVLAWRPALLPGAALLAIVAATLGRALLP